MQSVNINSFSNFAITFVAVFVIWGGAVIYGNSRSVSTPPLVSPPVIADTTFPTITNLPLLPTSFSAWSANILRVTFSDPGSILPPISTSISVTNGTTTNIFVPNSYGVNDFALFPSNNTASPLISIITYSVTDSAWNTTTATQNILIDPLPPLGPSNIVFNSPAPGSLSWNPIPSSMFYTVDNMSLWIFDICMHSSMFYCDVSAFSMPWMMFNITSYDMMWNPSSSQFMIP